MREFLMQKMLLVLLLLSFVCFDIQAGKSGKKSGSPRKPGKILKDSKRGLRMNPSSLNIRHRFFGEENRTQSAPELSDSAKDLLTPDKGKKGKNKGFGKKNRSRSAPDLKDSEEDLTTKAGRRVWIDTYLEGYTREERQLSENTREALKMIVPSTTSDESAKSNNEEHAALKDRIKSLERDKESLERDNDNLKARTERQSRIIKKKNKNIKKLTSELAILKTTLADLQNQDS